MSARHALAIAIFLSPALVFAADVTFRIERPTAYINLVGEIDRQTPAQLAKAIKTIRETTKGTILLHLDSGGGDVEAAFASGLLVREHEIYTVVPERASCASACALTFLGGVIRAIAGQYCIHRPYATRYIESDVAARRSYDRINRLTKEYLEQVNVTQRVLEAMNAVSPGDIRCLTKSERADLGIEATDPIFDDRTTSAYAKRIGITKRELYERQQRAKAICLSSSRMSVEERGRCYQDIVEGRRQ